MVVEFVHNGLTVDIRRNLAILPNIGDNVKINGIYRVVTTRTFDYNCSIIRIAITDIIY